MNCAKCGTFMDEKTPLCQQCGTFQPQNVVEFADLHNRAVEILRGYSSGKFDVNIYRERLQKLLVQDANGAWWTFDPANDRWLRFERNQWEEVVPGGNVLSTESPVGSLPADSKLKRKRLMTVLFVLLPLLVLIYFAGGFLLAGFDEYQALAKIIEDVPAAEDIPSPYVLSSAQTLIRSEYGPPESFSILFYQEEQMDGSFEDTRAETWTYYSAGKEFTFINGDLEGSDEITHDLAGIIPTGYVPEQFTAEMTLADLAAAAGLDTYLYIPLDSELVEDGRLYYAPQLAWGFKKSALAFVSGTALVEGGGQ